MYRSILVPLDRSSFAEQALPLALGIARRANARLELVEVHAYDDLEDPHAGWVPYSHEWDARRKRQEQLYLDATAKWLASSSPVSVTTALLPGSNVCAEFVADGILERARDCGADLIALATRALGFLNRVGFGSVADELVCRSGVPVLVLPPGPTTSGVIPEPTVNDVLVPLDGSPLAEQVLAPALDLASLMGARCSLLRVVEPPPSRGHGSGESSGKAQAEAYLARVAGRARARGLQVRTRAVVARHPAEAILAEAASLPGSLIALATHGRGGLSRLLLGSVAYKLVRAAASPVLVYRPSGKGL